MIKRPNIKPKNNHELTSTLSHIQKHIIEKLWKKEAENENILTWLRTQHQKNAFIGEIIFSLLSIDKDYIFQENEISKFDTSREILLSFENDPLPTKFFITTIFNQKQIGLLFSIERLLSGGLVYDVTVIEERKPLNQIIRMEFRFDHKQPEPFLSILTEDGYLKFTIHDFESIDIAKFTYRCLLSFHEKKYRSISMDKIVGEIFPRQKNNEVLVSLITDVHYGKVKCTKVKVPLSAVKPWDLDYAVAIPDDVIDEAISSVKKSFDLPWSLLLYQDGSQLIMDDDYICYLAYKALNITEVPAVIIGSFSEPLAKIIEVGGSELLPPIGVSINNAKPSSQNSKEDILHAKIKKLNSRNSIKSSVRKELNFAYFDFCHLLDNPSTKEKDLHKFIRNHPYLIDSTFTDFLSEVTIGPFRADLVLIYKQSDKKVSLIELERQDDLLFTKNNRFRKKVNHAIQQVEEWISTIRNQPEVIPDWLKGNVIPEGVIIIGRDKQLDDKQKEILHSVNNNRLVKILTYDDLLNRLHNMIKVLD